MGCSALAGLGDYSESPCEGPCAVGDTLDGLDGNGPDVPGDGVVDVGDAATDTNLESDSTGVDAAGDTATDSSPTDLGTDASPTCDGTASAMVNLGAFSIDRAEVTNAQYAAFLAASPATSGQPAACAWNLSFKPGGTWPVADSACDRPVVDVDWCDATAYCAWAGKRLCGSPITGSVPFAGASWTNALSDQWFDACTSNGTNALPYPGPYVAGRCVDAAYDGKLGTKPVASVIACQPSSSPYKGVFDLVGNVAEWEDCCEKSTGATDHCRVRGGSYLDDMKHASCDGNTVEARNAAQPDVGIRCCSK